MEHRGIRKQLLAIVASAAFVLALLLQIVNNAKPIQAQSVQPNIILIITDDQRWDSLAYMPHLQSELVAQGVTFRNAFATTSLCCPSRASVLTGQYAHSHGVIDNAGAVNLFDDSSTLATWLQNAGYRTALIGKYLNGYTISNVPPGWDEWRVFTHRQEHFYYNYTLNENGNLVSYGSQPADYSTDVLATKAVNFIHASAGTPFFLYLAPAAPHAPHIPAPRHIGTYASLSPWRPPSFNEADVSDKPVWLQGQPLLNPNKANRERIGQLESALAVDDALLRILQALDDIGQRNNTVIIFLSDQGLGWGEHRWLDKRCPYEECIRIPLLMVYPSVTSPGIAEDRFALNIDLAPTILDFAGVAVPPGVEGTSLLPLLDGSAGDWRTDFLIEQWQGNSRITSYTGLRNEAWTYVEYTTGEIELYELAADPYQLVNVATNPAYAQVVAMLANRLDELLSQGGPTATPIVNTTTPTPIQLTQTPTPTPTVLTVTNTPISSPSPRPSGTPMPTRQITPRPTMTATPNH